MRKLIFTILIAAGCLQAAAERTVPFFDTSRPDKVIALGLRAGMNSSGVSTNYMDKQPELIQSNFYWHSGVQVGAIADLSIRKFLAIEVGLFWERHGYDAAMMAATAAEDYMGSQFTRVRYNDIHIPVLMSWRFNILPQAVWSVDLGPYFSYGLSGTKKADSYIAFGEEDGQLVFDHNISNQKYFKADPKDFLAVNRFDAGLKVGTGLAFFSHYTISVYYQRSVKNNAKDFDGGADYRLRNCSWSVNIGYNF